MAASNCLSALSLVDSGRQLVIRKNPFPAFFELFHEPDSIPFPEKFSVMGDMPTLFGSNLEELLRHHPPLMRPCIRAMVAELKAIANLAECCDGVTLDATFDLDDSCEGKCYRYTSLLHAATSALHCLEGLLKKVEHVKEFLVAGGLASLLRVLQVALGPPRYFLASLSCCLETTLHAVGYYPIVKTITRLFNVLADKESKMFMNRIFTALDMQLDKLSTQLNEQHDWEEKSGVEQKEDIDDKILDGDSFQHSGQFPLHKWLTYFTRKPLHHCAEDGKLSPALLHGTKSLQAFITVDFLVDALSHVIHVLTNDPRQRPALSQLAENRNLQVLSRLIDEVYVGSQVEVARARGSLSGIVNLEDRATTKDHPVYKLLVVAQDSVNVRESPNDPSSKKVFKLEKGSIFYADSRGLSSNNMLQYHLYATDVGVRNRNDNGEIVTRTNVDKAVSGWVYVHRNVNTVDPQIEVIDILHPESRCDDIKLSIPTEDVTSTIKSTDDTTVQYDKLANVSPHKAGFMCLFHLHGCMRNLMSALAWCCSPCTDHPAFSRMTQQVMPPQTTKLVPLVINCILRLLPNLNVPEDCASDGISLPPMFSSADVMEGGDVKAEFFVTNPSDTENDSKSGSVGSASRSSCPSLERLSTAHAFRTIYVIELCHYLLFEDKKGTRSEPNMVILVHLFHCGLLERLANSSSQLFLACLDPSVPIEESVATGASAASAPERDCKLELFTTMAKYDPTIYVSRSGHSSSSDDSIEITPEEVIKRKLHDRRLLVVADIDMAIDLWKNFFRLMPVMSARSNQVLQEVADDAHHFDANIFKRKVFLLWIRYLGQTWSHELLYTLPPTVVNNVLELVQMVLKTLLESNTSQLRSTSKLTTSTSSPNVDWISNRRRERFVSQLNDNAERSSNSGVGMDSVLIDDMDVDVEVEVELEEEGVDGISDSPSSNVSSSASRTRRRSQSWGGSTRREAGPRASTLSRSAELLEESEDVDDVIGTLLGDLRRRRGSGGGTSVRGGVSSNGSSSGRSRRNSVSDTNELQDIEKAIPPNTDLCNGLRLLPQPLPHMLPVIARSDDAEVKADRALVYGLYKSLYAIVPDVCLRLIERGIRASMSALPDVVSPVKSAQSKTAAPIVSREITTVVVLNQMILCLERPNWHDSTLKIIQLASLYERATTLLRGELTVTTSLALYGVLHAILLILSNKVVSPANRPPTPANKGRELLFLIFGRLGPFSEMYSLLLSALEQTCSSVTQFSVDKSRPCVPNTVCFDWMTPAFLILDTISQPILIDSSMLQSTLKELEKVYKRHIQNPLEGYLLNIGDDIKSLKDLIPISLQLFMKYRYKVDCNFDSETLTKEMNDKKSIPKDPSLSNQRKSPRFIKCSVPVSGASSTTDDDIDDEVTVESGICGNETASILPLLDDNGLTVQQLQLLVRISLDLLDLLDPKEVRGHLTAQALLQGMLHYTRLGEVRSLILDTGGVGRVIKSCCRFRDKGSTLFTLLQHLIEDDSYLRKSMETAMKLCVQRVYRSSSGAFEQDKRSVTRGMKSTSKSSNLVPRVTVKLFLEILAPLIYRNQRLFLDILKEEFRLFKDPRQADILCVGLLRGGLSVPIAELMTSSASKTDEPKKMDSSNRLASSSHRSNTDDKDRQPNDYSHPTSSTSSSPSQVIQTVVDHLVLSLFEQWVTMKRLEAEAADEENRQTDNKQSNTKAKPLPVLDESHNNLLISISELLVLLADLVTVVPGFATCVHKFSLHSALARLPQTTLPKSHELLKYCLGEIPHVITGRIFSPHSSHFLTFLVHYIIVSDDSIAGKFPLPKSQCHPEEKEDTKGKSIHDRLLQITGNAIQEAPSYLFAALVARAGDGRRRALKELLNALRLTHSSTHPPTDTGGGAGVMRSTVPVSTTLDTTAKLRAALCLACNIKHLLYPKAAWRQSEMLVVPTKEIVEMLLSLKCYAILSEAMCAIPLHHPLALQVSLELAIPLEFFVKKGLPSVSPSETKVANCVKRESIGAGSGRRRSSSHGLSRASGVGNSSTSVVGAAVRTNSAPSSLSNDNVNTTSVATGGDVMRSRSSSVSAVPTSAVSGTSSARRSRGRRNDPSVDVEGVTATAPISSSPTQVQDKRRRVCSTSGDVQAGVVDSSNIASSSAREVRSDSMETNGSLDLNLTVLDDELGITRGVKRSSDSATSTNFDDDSLLARRVARQAHTALLASEDMDEDETMNLNLSVLSDNHCQQERIPSMNRAVTMDLDLGETPIESLDSIEGVLDVDSHVQSDNHDHDDDDDDGNDVDEDDDIVAGANDSRNFFAHRSGSDTEGDDCGDDSDDDDEGMIYILF